MEVKNITPSVYEKVLVAVGRHAMERNSSLNALVRDYLTKLTGREKAIDRTVHGSAGKEDLVPKRFALPLKSSLDRGVLVYTAVETGKETHKRQRALELIEAEDFATSAQVLRSTKGIAPALRGNRLGVNRAVYCVPLPGH